MKIPWQHLLKNGAKCTGLSVYFRAFGLVPTKNLSKLGEILKIICDNGFSINNCAMFDLDIQQSNDLTKTFGFGVSDETWCSGYCVALVLTGCDAFNRLNQLVAGIFLHSRIFFVLLKINQFVH